MVPSTWIFHLCFHMQMRATLSWSESPKWQFCRTLQEPRGRVKFRIPHHIVSINAPSFVEIRQCLLAKILFTDITQTNVQIETGLTVRWYLCTIVSQIRASRRLRPVAISARLAPLHASYHGPELVWATGRLMSSDRGFATSCLLHCSHLTVSANSEDS